MVNEDVGPCLHCQKPVSFSRDGLREEDEFAVLCRPCHGLVQWGFLSLAHLRRVRGTHQEIKSLRTELTSMQRDIAGLYRAQQDVEQMILSP